MTACSHVVNIGGILNRERQEQKAQVSIKCRTGDDALSVWLMITVCLLSPLMESATSDAAFLGLRVLSFLRSLLCHWPLLVLKGCYSVSLNRGKVKKKYRNCQIFPWLFASRSCLEVQSRVGCTSTDMVLIRRKRPLKAVRKERMIVDCGGGESYG